MATAQGSLLLSLSRQHSLKDPRLEGDGHRAHRCVWTSPKLHMAAVGKGVKVPTPAQEPLARATQPNTSLLLTACSSIS